ncbi:MAG: flagellar hook-basal body complex protein [Sphingomonadaceae bacterium]
MLRSMSSAISGLRNHQTYMDVVGHNIANVNTVGFKASRINFKEALAQTYRVGSEPVPNGMGGTNPAQVGLGVTLGGIDTIMTQGPMTPTGKTTDLAIQGEGFFMLGTPDAGGNVVPAYFTRDGAFSRDEAGYLVDPVSGQYLLGGDPAAPDRILIDPAWGWANFAISSDGTITGVLADGTTDTVNRPQILLAKFNNPEGLLRAGGSLFQEGLNSGDPIIGAPGDNTIGMGTLMSGTLEGSNVELAEQFTRMIMAERGFQANSRIITASDEMLQDLVNMKR